MTESALLIPPAAATAEGAAEESTARTQRTVKPVRSKPKKPGADEPCSLPTPSPQQQRQRDREFSSHKVHILSHLQSSACDLSPKGSVDVKCLPAMKLLNTHADYITTSSCSGRIALFHAISLHDAAPQDEVGVAKLCRKRGDDAALGWMFVKHGMLLPKEMSLVVDYLCGKAETAEDVALDSEQVALHMAHMTALCGAAEDEKNAPAKDMYGGEVEGVLVEAVKADGNNINLAVPSRGTVSLKMEPFVMHVECRTMEAAKRLLSAAVSDSGYRNSGVIPPGKKIMCGIRGTTGLGLEVPLVVHGVNYIAGQRAYVWALLKLANEKMHANEAKIHLLERSIASRLGASEEERREKQRS